MPEANATVVDEQVPTTETDASQVNGTDVDESTKSVDTAQQEQDKVEKAEYEALKKELDKAKQEINLRRNKEKELELKTLEETGKWKEAYEKLQEERQAELEQKQKEQQEKEIYDLRDRILTEFPDVADVAKSLNLWWDDAQTTDEAEAQLRTKLEALQSKLGGSQEQDPDIHPNNPSVSVGGVALEDMSLEELRKILPRTDR